MSIRFNSIVKDAGLAPQEVSLLRHQDNRASKGRTPYVLWRDHRDDFEFYQSHQSIKNRPKFQRPYWAAFVGTPDNETLFVGVYAASYRGLLDHDTKLPHTEGIDKAGSCDVYDVRLHDALADLRGKLFVQWGEGFRAWVQHADRQDKAVIEVRREFKEPEFPGFLNFVEQLSRLEKLPHGWIGILRESGGVYLLTCPRTKEQYVGSATGSGGFWGRWQQYADTGHGGNLALKSREPSDYRVSILEVAGTAMTETEILAKENLWKEKLQSREMGLNRN